MEDYEREDLEGRTTSEDSDDSLFEDDYTIHEELFHLKDKKMPVSVTDVIDKASRFIFAEDLVRYISSEFHGLVYSNKIEKCSKNIFSPFNETIKHATCVIRWQINQQNCPSFELIGKLSKSHITFYETFVEAILSHYSEKGLKAGVFLYFCVYIAELASKCYRPDFEDVLDFAVYAILDAFCIFNEGLYELNNFAKNILSKLKDRSSYLDLWGTQVDVLEEEHCICENQCFKNTFLSHENNVEGKRSALEEQKLGDKSDKCDVIRNLKDATNKITENSKENELKEYRASLERLDLVDKSNICEAISNLEFSLNTIADNNQNNEVVKHRASLEELQLIDKSSIYETISNLEFVINIIENKKDNEIEKHRASLEQLKLVDKSDKCEAISNSEIYVNKITKDSKKNEVEENRAYIEQLKEVEKSVKCEAISNLEFAMNKHMKNSAEYDLEEYIIALQRLQLAEKSVKCEFINNLEFTVNNITENTEEYEVEEYRAALEQLNLVDKSTKCQIISDIQSALNKIMENNKDNEVVKYRVASDKLKLVNKSDKCKARSNLECVQNKVIENSKEDELEEYLAALEQLKLIDKSTKCKVKNNLEFDINKIGEKCQENDVEEYRAALEQIKLVDNSKESEVINNLEFAINKNIESLFKSAGSSEKDIEFSSSENCIALLIDELCLAECENLSSASESYIFGDLLQEIMSVVNYEASIFSEIYFPQDNKVKTDPNLSYIIEHKDVKFLNSALKECEYEKDQLKIQTSKIKSDKNSATKTTEDFTQLKLENATKDPSSISDHSALKQVVRNFIEYNAESQTSVILNSALTQQEEERKDVVSSATLEKDIKFTNSKSTGLEIQQGHLISQSLAENSDKNVIIQLAENFTKLDCKDTNDSDFTVEYSPATKVDDKQIVECFVVYKQEGEISEEKLKVLKGDSLLFAEDLIKYIAKEFYSISYPEPKFEEIRHLSRNALDENLKEVALFIHDESEIVNSMVFNFISNFKEHLADWYRKYVVAILSHFVDDGLNSDVFLYYCLHFSELALKLYTLDFPEILDFATCSILDAFCLLKDDWNDFKVAIENLLKLFKTRKDNKNSNLLCFYFSDNLERVCVNTICDLLKSYTEEKIEIYLNNSMALKNEDPTVLPKTLEISSTDEDILEQNKN